MSEANIKTVQAIYGAFGRGDVAAILEHLADDAEFSFNTEHPAFPWHATFRGKGEIPKFFGALASGTTMQKFEPEAFTAGGPHVAVAVRLEHVPKATGREVVERQVQWWTFDARGKVTRLVHYTDTAKVAASARG